MEKSSDLDFDFWIVGIKNYSGMIKNSNILIKIE